MPPRARVQICFSKVPRRPLKVCKATALSTTPRGELRRESMGESKFIVMHVRRKFTSASPKPNASMTQKPLTHNAPNTTPRPSPYAYRNCKHQTRSWPLAACPSRRPCERSLRQRQADRIAHRPLVLRVAVAEVRDVLPGRHLINVPLKVGGARLYTWGQQL